MGTYNILFNNNRQGNINTSEFPIKVLETVCSNTFTVYTAKRFPGMIGMKFYHFIINLMFCLIFFFFFFVFSVKILETTRLACCFVKQGNKIPNRRVSKKRKFDEIEDTKDIEETRKSKKKSI
jgi:hypothetical protein